MELNRPKRMISLKFKLLLLFATLPVVILGIYLFVAVNLFQEDKIAYAYDMTLAFTKSLSTETDAELRSIENRMIPILKTLDFKTSKYAPMGDFLFDRDTDLRALYVYSDGGAPPVALVRPGFKAPDHKEAFAQVQKDEFALQVVSGAGTEREMVAYAKTIKIEGVGRRYIVAILELDNFLKNFVTSGTATNLLVSKNGEILLGTYTSLVGHPIFSKIRESRVPRGTFTAAGPAGEPLLVSYSRLAREDLYTLSITPRSQALKAVQALIKKSIVFFIALVAFSVLISVLASNGLTKELRKLQFATQKIAEGNFGIRVDVNSQDEVGALAEGFNRMTSEISRLMDDNVAKARMEKELETAKMVQETLFPKGDAVIGNYEISGFYQPASEVGGDIWHYSETETQIFLWVGDATGHGAGAALITSAAKAVISLLESTPGMTPGAALHHMNRSINSTSKGQILMTFFIAAVNKKTGEMIYANASHEPPYLLRSKEGEILKDSLEPLNDVNGPRLGESGEATYPEERVQLNAGDFVYFYTDGVSDIHGPAGTKPWNKRHFVKTLLLAANSRADAHGQVQKIRTDIEDFRQGTELADDVTVVGIKVGQAA